MTLTTPGRNMLAGIGDAAEKTVGSDPTELPTNADLPALLTQVIASQAEAEAGSENTKRMTALRVAQAIAKLGLGLRRGGSLALSSGTGGVITNLGGIVNADLLEIWFAGVTASGSDHLLIQLGTGGALETSGYVSASGASSGGGTFTSSTSGLVIYQGGSGVFTGGMRLHRVTGNQWVSHHSMQVSTSGGVTQGGGQKTLAGALDRIGIGFTGANTFTAGAAYVLAGNVA